MLSTWCLRMRFGTLLSSTKAQSPFSVCAKANAYLYVFSLWSIIPGRFFTLSKKEALEAFVIYDRFIFECSKLDSIFATAKVNIVTLSDHSLSTCQVLWHRGWNHPQTWKCTGISHRKYAKSPDVSRCSDPSIFVGIPLSFDITSKLFAWLSGFHRHHHHQLWRRRKRSQSRPPNVTSL